MDVNNWVAIGIALGGWVAWFIRDSRQSSKTLSNSLKVEEYRKYESELGKIESHLETHAELETLFWKVARMEKATYEDEGKEIEIEVYFPPDIELDKVLEKSEGYNTYDLLTYKKWDFEKKTHSIGEKLALLDSSMELSNSYLQMVKEVPDKAYQVIHGGSYELNPLIDSLRESMRHRRTVKKQIETLREVKLHSLGM